MFAQASSIVARSSTRGFHASACAAAKMSLAQVPKSELKGKRVFVRADLNVPLKGGAVSDDTRIRESIPTLKLLTDAGARVILTSHLGRPKGVTKGLELDPVAENLRKMMGGKTVTKINTVIGAEAQAAADKLKDGEILLLENVRFHKEEEKNVADFAKALSMNADLYVNDAFGAAHRAHASTAGVAKYIPRRVAGLLMEKELKFLNEAVLNNPKKPFAAIIGGSKVSTKTSVLSNLMKKVDTLIIGGGMIFTFLKARKLEVGKSLCEMEQIGAAQDIVSKAGSLGVDLVLPVDVVVAPAPDTKDASQVKVVDVDKIPSDMAGLDIGPKSIKLFQDKIGSANTILWNGPMGVFENPLFAKGTNSLVSTVAGRTGKGATTVVGGGETVSAVTKAGAAKSMSHVSTGGGASLELLEGLELPGVAALDEAK